MASYGVDWNGPLPTDDDAERVVVPDISIKLDDEEYAELQETIDPKAFSTDYGIDLYLATMNFIDNKLHSE